MPPRRSGLSWLAKRSSRLWRRSRQTGQTSISTWSQQTPGSLSNSMRIAFASGSTQWQRPPESAKLKPETISPYADYVLHAMIWSYGRVG
uniref:Uncharacterized protein n=1 Tax=Oryza brachyantha TaxID=4533 RepID=J3M5N7_ORYBR